MHIILLFLLSTLFCQAHAARTDEILFVLDMDRMFINEKARVYADTDPREYFKVGDEHYRMAPFSPEFIVALRFKMSQILGAPTRLAIFSGGSHRRNVGVVQTMRLSANLELRSVIDEVRSFQDLTLLKPIPNGVPRDQALQYFRSLGGQDFVPFFDIFSKDLSQFNVPLDRVIIFEDNSTAVPDSQVKNLLIVARPDIQEEFFEHDSRESKNHWAEESRRSPVQIARARYRLVRAIGTLNLAAKRFKAGEFDSLVDALDAVQWDEDGRFKSASLNQKAVYDEGLKILEAAYREYLLPYDPAIQRDPDYFKILPVVPRKIDCEDYLIHSDGALPWQAKP